MRPRRTRTQHMPADAAQLRGGFLLLVRTGRTVETHAHTRAHHVSNQHNSFMVGRKVGGVMVGGLCGRVDVDVFWLQLQHVQCLCAMMLGRRRRRDATGVFRRRADGMCTRRRHSVKLRKQIEKETEGENGIKHLLFICLSLCLCDS